MHAPHLKTIIPSLCSPDPSPELLREFVYLCRNIAVAYLRTKVKNGRLDPNAFGINLEDLALDCIADLFERKEGRFVELVNYYRRVDCRASTDEELLGATRRLVFSKVNEGLFRHYRDNDRSLSNTIRNLKSAVQFSRTLFPLVRNGELWIQLMRPDSGPDHLPLIPPEYIEARLVRRREHQRGIRGLLDEFAEVLSEQNIYRKEYPLIGLAIILRAAMVRDVLVESDTTAEPLEISPDEIRQFVRSSIERVKSSMRPTYVEKGKFPDGTLNLYFECIEEILDAEYISNDGMDLTYYEMFRKRISTITESQYRKHHRVYLEYLAKLTRKEFLQSIKKELEPS
ncbi:MAG TPA: hypothetical protein VI758_00545 [Bacteroidota bacterium]